MILHADGSSPKPNQIFVFGSNEAGRHGAGAARFAVERLGAVWGKAEGLMGMSYGIPTKDKDIESLDTATIHEYVCNFLDFVKEHPELQFFITRIGCVLAGYKDSDIAPMFVPIAQNVNCSFPVEWSTYLQKNHL